MVANVTSDQTTGKVRIQHVSSLMVNAKRAFVGWEYGGSYLSKILKGRNVEINQSVVKGTIRLPEHEKLHTSCDGLLELYCDEWVGLKAIKI